MAHKRNKLQSPIVEWFEGWRKDSGEESKPLLTWKWSWWQIVKVLLVVWLLCLLSPQIRLGIEIATKRLNHTVRGTNRAEWGMWSQSSPPSKQIAPEKLLCWSKNAVVERRKRVTTEVTHNGVCFVDIVPPGVKTEFTFSCAVPNSSAPWQTYLVEHNVHGFRSPQELAQRAVSKHHVRDGIFLIKEMISIPGEVMRHSFSFANKADGVSESPVLCEEYLQTSDGLDHEIGIDRVPTGRIYQFEVQVGIEECSFTLQNHAFRWLWIAPVHCIDRQLHVGNIPVPAKGMAEEARTMFRDFSGDNARIAPFAITATVGDKEVPLKKSILLRPEDVSPGEIKLRINAPQGAGLETQVKPAKIIVGYQL